MKKRCFENLDPKIDSKRSVLDLLRWKIFSKIKAWPDKLEDNFKPQLPTHVKKEEAYITFINHATTLIQLQNLNILTDPLFSEAMGPFGKGPRRVRAPGLLLEELPKIDAVLISHNHYDHLDFPSIQALWKKDRPLFIVPLENGRFLRSLGIDTIIELDWWQEHVLNDEQRVILTPAQHWSRRGLQDYCQSLWGGFLIRSSHLKVFFAGDTGYNTHFRQIYERYGKIDVSLLPIGAYEPQWFMQAVHMNPNEAIQAHLDLESSLSIGIHFGTFRLTDEGIHDPVLHLRESLSSRKIHQGAFIAPANGQTIKYLS